jgi:hypothetical protein
MSKSTKRPVKPGKAAPFTAKQIKLLANLDAKQAKLAIVALNRNPHLGIPGWLHRANWAMEVDGSPVSDDVWDNFIGSIADSSDLDFAQEEAGVIEVHEDTKGTTKE